MRWHPPAGPARPPAVVRAAVPAEVPAERPLPAARAVGLHDATRAFRNGLAARPPRHSSSQTLPRNSSAHAAGGAVPAIGGGVSPRGFRAELQPTGNIAAAGGALRRATAATAPPLRFPCYRCGGVPMFLTLLCLSTYGSPKVRVGHFARLSRGGCSSRLVQQSIIIPMTADAEWKPKARRMITRTLLCSPSTMPLVTPQRM